jgi:hypothetical protein
MSFYCLWSTLTKPPRRTLDAREKKANPTTVRRHTELLELRNTLSRNMAELRQSQRIYMPGLCPVFEDEGENSDGPTKLWLPSELSQDDRVAWCLPGIPELELRFRYAQADDGLAEIRRLRRMLQGLRDQNAKHPNQVQRSRTRTRGVFERFEARIQRAVKRYRHSRQALLSLDPSQKLSPGWVQRFRVLEDADIRGPGRESYETSEGAFQPSWIWLVPRSPNPAPNGGLPPDEPIATTSAGVNTNTTDSASATTDDPEVANSVSAAVDDPEVTNSVSATIDDPEVANSISAIVDDPEVDNSMRAHWAKCQARADRYEEEAKLTVEEMGRTLRYFEWKKKQWASLRSERERTTTPPPLDVQQGLYAYSYRQIHVYETLVVSFANRWRKLLTLHGLGKDWLHRYPVATDPLSTRATRGHGGGKSKPTRGKSKPTRGNSKPTQGRYKPTVLEPHLVSAGDPFTKVGTPSSSLPTPPPDVGSDVDPPPSSLPVPPPAIGSDVDPSPSSLPAPSPVVGSDVPSPSSLPAPSPVIGSDVDPSPSLSPVPPPELDFDTDTDPPMESDMESDSGSDYDIEEEEYYSDD